MPLAPRTAQEAGRDGKGRAAEQRTTGPLVCTQCVCRTRIREALLSPLSSYFCFRYRAGLVYMPATLSPLGVTQESQS